MITRRPEETCGFDDMPLTPAERDWLLSTSGTGERRTPSSVRISGRFGEVTHRGEDTMNSAEINAFFSNPSDKDQSIYESFRALAHGLGRTLPVGRGRALAFTKLQEAFMWTVVARQPREAVPEEK